MFEDFYAVIMAGGGGTRLWPLSRRARPKQQLRLVGERTLFQMAVDRLLPMLPAERIIVITVAEQLEALREQTPDLPESSFLIEPEGRGTASVIGLGAAVLRERHGESTMACLPADHFVENDEKFRECLMAAYDAASNGYLVTLGITPTYPATGYGYIHRRNALGSFRGFEAFEVESFREKPSRTQAEEYLATGEYAWNSGMFIWRTSRILEEIESQMKHLHQGLLQIVGNLGTDEEHETIERIWRGLESQTIDYGIMERASQVATIAADELGWFDIGGWAGLWNVLPEDEQGNLILAENALAIESNGSLVFQEAEGKSKRLIAMLGVTDLIIVDTGDALLICPRDRAEEVRKVVDRLDSEDRKQYL